MHIYLLIIFVLLVIFGPGFWAKQVLRKYNETEYFSGNGFDLARTMLQRMGLSQIKVEETLLGDHYDPVEKVIRLTRKNCGKRSLTAVAVAAHEVGHAVQDQTGYAPLHARTKLVTTAVVTEKIGAGLMIAIPVVTVMTRVPAIGLLTFLAALAVLAMPVIVHLVTLPVEWDASFKRALPLLESGNYIPKEDLRSARRILRACALTYVASALASLLNIWRWLRILKR